MINRDSLWVTRQDEEVAIKDMKDGHIEACIKLIYEAMPHGGWRTGYLPALEKELEHRKFVKSTPLGKALE